jgi:hypothetical protein
LHQSLALAWFSVPSISHVIDEAHGNRRTRSTTQTGRPEGRPVAFQFESELLMQ